MPLLFHPKYLKCMFLQGHEGRGHALFPVSSADPWGHVQSGPWTQQGGNEEIRDACFIHV